MTWVTMEREVRRDIEVSPVCRVFLDLQAQQVSREPQELSDQAAPGDLLDLLDPMERKDMWDSLGQWDLLELVDSVEKLGQRALQERLDPQVHPVPRDLP